MRHLVVVLGDQLDRNSTAFDGFDAGQDMVWMAEVAGESTHVWSHKVRIAMFLSSMRHFAEALGESGVPVVYRMLGDSENRGTLDAELRASLGSLRPKKLVVVEPGEWRVLEMLRSVAKEAKVPLEVRPDRHFLCSTEEFQAWAKGRSQLRLEFFYRFLRQKTGVLMDAGQPAGGSWNYDKENRSGFGKKGPGLLVPPLRFVPDALTRQVTVEVQERFGEHPGKLETFDYPVTNEQARLALDDFVEHRLPTFGQYQDAMWEREPILYHSRLSAAMNLKLLDPRDVIEAAERAWRSGHAPIAAVEGFVRQVLGWREYVRGVYWAYMPEYLQRNALDAELDLPQFYWTGETEMNCLKHALGQTLEYGYAHHIQRLMVTGLYALLLGVRPQAVHEWYLAIYVDAVEWVELPNTLGMSQFGDGGIMGSKPYVASGRYIQRMSNYCAGCKYDPAESTGETACPFTTLYWDFLMRHEPLLRGIHRMDMQMKNLDRLRPVKRDGIRRQADQLKQLVISLPS